MGKLYFSVGSSRSGKSTFAKRWAAEAPMRCVISADAIRLALYGRRYEHLAESFVFAMKFVMARCMLDSGYDVLLDETHTSHLSILRVLEVRPDAEPIFFDTSEEECIRRAILTEQEDLIPIIKRHHENIRKIKKIGFENMRKEILDKLEKR